METIYGYLEVMIWKKRERMWCGRKGLASPNVKGMEISPFLIQVSNGVDYLRAFFEKIRTI
jgi:hypothetical protein